MRKFLIFNLLVIAISLTATAQDKQGFKEIEDTSWKNIYRGVPSKENELVHTKLVANFNYTKSQLNGEAWLDLRPYLNATSTLSLDAKGMDIHQVGLMMNKKMTALKYVYDGLIIKIQLDKSYTPSENYTVYIKYTAKIKWQRCIGLREKGNSCPLLACACQKDTLKEEQLASSNNLINLKLSFLISAQITIELQQRKLFFQI
jgi:hypothetical protein